METVGSGLLPLKVIGVAQRTSYHGLKGGP